MSLERSEYAAHQEEISQQKVVRERRFLLKETEGPAGIRGRDSVVPVGE
jgi:hypothetical protein